MLRVVADTNVYLSALHFGGVAEDVLLLGRTGQIELFVSPPLLKELEDVLVRKFHWSPLRARSAMRLIRTFTSLVAPRNRVDILPDDDADNRILECALEARAHIIVTGDKRLQRLGQVQGLRLLSPREFLDAYAASARSP